MPNSPTSQLLHHPPLGRISAPDVHQAGVKPRQTARDRLFDPFFTTKADGTGLGLAIAARIVERHGGTLEYQSSKADGTCFSIALPASA